MNEQEALWAGEFGDAYLERNVVDPASRINFWKWIVGTTQCHTAFEFGCSRGHNLIALKSLGVFPFGMDINRAAIADAREKGLQVLEGDTLTLAHVLPRSVDLVFTAGVLIHIPPADLYLTMDRLAGLARRYVLAVEYEAHDFQSCEYRGKENALWKGPYGRMYETMGLKLVERLEEPAGFDRCTAWLLEKA